eukprot:COSAG01_NODE_47576_length_389_cov_0.706897_1_plen_25_part_01
MTRTEAATEIPLQLRPFHLRIVLLR